LWKKIGDRTRKTGRNEKLRAQDREQQKLDCNQRLAPAKLQENSSKPQRKAVMMVRVHNY